MGKCKVLICVDHSSNAESAFNFYRENLYRPDHEIVFVHVSECITLPVLDYVTVALDEEANRIHQRNESLKQKFGELCKKDDIPHSVQIIPGEEGILNALTDIIKSSQANLIVMGTRGLGTFRRTFLGSVSDYIIHHSHIPVVICPP